MQAVPEKIVTIGLVLLIWAGTSGLGLLGPGRAAAENLQVWAAASQAGGGDTALQVTWRWNPPGGSGWEGREELLAVTFDSSLVFVSDEAAAGRGGGGEALRCLEERAGLNGARRLYVIPRGRDGSVTVRLRPTHAGTSAAGTPVRVHVVFQEPTEKPCVKELEVPFR